MNPKISRYNNGDNIERNVEITNYLVRGQLAKTTKKLERKRKDYNDKRKIVQEQWADLKQKESTLRQNFIKFNKVWLVPSNVFAYKGIFTIFSVCEGKPGEKEQGGQQNNRTKPTKGGEATTYGGATGEMRKRRKH